MLKLVLSCSNCDYELIGCPGDAMYGRALLLGWSLKRDEAGALCPGCTAEAKKSPAPAPLDGLAAENATEAASFTILPNDSELVTIPAEKLHHLEDLEYRIDELEGELASKEAELAERAAGFEVP